MRKKIWMHNFRIEYIFRSDRRLLFSGMNMLVRTTALISSTGRLNKQSKPFSIGPLFRLYSEEGKDKFTVNTIPISNVSVFSQVRSNVLGHMQQGGWPSPFDRCPMNTQISNFLALFLLGTLQQRWQQRRWTGWLSSWILALPETVSSNPGHSGQCVHGWNEMLHSLVKDYVVGVLPSDTGQLC